MSDPNATPPQAESTFADILVQFTNFLVRQGLSPNLLWVFQEDVLECWPLVYVRVPLTNDVVVIDALYQAGIERGLGIEMGVFCLLEYSPCCYLYLPEDSADASQRMMLTGLKMSVPTEPIVAIPVTNWAKWAWLKWWHCRGKKPRCADALPRRSAVRWTSRGETG